MSPAWNDRRLTRRVRAGDGRALKPFRWWQLMSRSVLSLTLPVDGRAVVHTVEVRHGGDATSGVVRAGLYLDGRLRAESKLPARFPVTGGHIEVRNGRVGLRRCHFVGDDGIEQQLQPDPRSAEGRRLRFARRRPRASAVIGAVSTLALIVGTALNVVQAAEPLSRIPFVLSTVGAFNSPLDLPVWLNVSLGLVAVVGAAERATRLRYHWLLDGAGT